ncbi:helix-hairpin-helix domain-containing protein [Mediannikoviicoccus vaginalis]|uniref:helix-hairpin-helix domain-containing protein n=1 Tax=Mediannikoviicoccus vaginalis TaxID=2899727 RepID=UPI001F1FCC7C|nr:helix-hairpin-helix domain-containing protein [Mediannikoviicoccus vaginalis]
MLKRNKDKIIIIILVAVLTGVGFYKSNSSIEEPEQNLLQFANTNVDETSEKPKEVYVHIDGEVVNPGLYKLTTDDRVNDLLVLAGGATDKASLKDVNLAKRLEDEMKIYIPSKDEIGSNEVSGQSGLSSSTGKINLNTASKDELKTLPGIGDSRADEIIRYRENTGFSKLEDIKNISGIGDKTYEKLKDLISVY